MEPPLHTAIMKTIRSMGFSVGWTRLVDDDVVVNATHGETLESFSVQAEDPTAAWIELARQVGISIDD
jgi:hypothetical protein